MAKICEYLVAGDGPFPLDMLRHDRSWPADQLAVQLIDGAGIHHNSTATREIRLKTLARGPDLGRWASMGWKVVEQRRR